MKTFRWNRCDAGNGQMAEVNMTPLIDVSLVLVVILLLATPLAFEASMGLQRTATAAVGEEALAPPIRLDILSEDEVAVNGAGIAVRNLPLALAPLLAAGNNRSVAVRCAGRVSHGTFVQVLDIARLSGATGVAVSDIEPGVKRQ